MLRPIPRLAPVTSARRSSRGGCAWFIDTYPILSGLGSKDGSHRLWLQPVFLLKMRDGAEISICGEENEVVTKCDCGNQRIYRFQLPPLATQHNLRLGCLFSIKSIKIIVSVDHRFVMWTKM